MAGLDYTGIVERWKTELIVERARRMGLKEHDIEDAQQEIVLKIMDFQYEDDKSNGATEKTVLTALIDNCLKKMLRTEARYRIHVIPYEDDMEPVYDPNDAEHLAIDVRLVCDALCEPDRLVCKALQAGYSKRAIVSKFGCGWHQINRITEALRARLGSTRTGGADDE